MGSVLNNLFWMYSIWWDLRTALWCYHLILIKLIEHQPWNTSHRSVDAKSLYHALQLLSVQSESLHAHAFQITSVWRCCHDNCRVWRLDGTAAPIRECKLIGSSFLQLINCFWIPHWDWWWTWTQHLGTTVQFHSILKSFDKVSPYELPLLIGWRMAHGIFLLIFILLLIPLIVAPIFLPWVWYSLSLSYLNTSRPSWISICILSRYWMVILPPAPISLGNLRSETGTGSKLWGRLKEEGGCHHGLM